MTKFDIEQRIDELKKAIARDPRGEHSDVDRRQRELDDLEDELKNYE